MTDEEKYTLEALIKGVTKTKGNQYYEEEYIDETGIKILKNFVKTLDKSI